VTPAPDHRTTEPDLDAVSDTGTLAAGAVLSTVAIATFLLMPQFIEAAVADLHFSEQQVGILSSLVEIGTTVAAVGATFWIRRSSWQMAATLSLIGLMAANAASLVVHGYAPLLILQGIVGFCGGSLYSLSLTVLSDTPRPDRGFAFAIGAQTIYQIFGLIGGPFLLHHGGFNAMLWLFIALSACGLPLLRWIPAHGRHHAAAASAGGLLTGPVLLALVGCFLFYVNIGAYWTYIERIGTTAGLGLSAISNGLAFSNAASLAGVFLASWLGSRRGFLMPIWVSAVAILISLVLLTGHLQLPAYVLSAVIYGIAWNLSMAFQYSTVNVVDRSRCGVALTPAFHNAGGAVGPAIAALFVTEHDHVGVLWVCTVTASVSVVCFWLALRLHARPHTALVPIEHSS
jgi:predicted MFS family arabinose efflux permease